MSDSDSRHARARIGLATSSDHPLLPPGERRLVDALRARGANATPVVWDDRAVDWRSFHVVLLRSCWDYHLRPAEFLAWLDRLDREGVRVENPPALVRWNVHKSYLLDLAARGVPVPPTLAPRDVAEAETWLAGRPWGEIVVKPLVSATAHETWRAALPLDAESRARLARAIGDGGPLDGALLQPYLEGIAREGEHSFVFVAGHYSHVVLKRPKAGDFRVQEEHGGTVEAAAPSVTAIAAAERVMAAAGTPQAPGPHLYGRVDALVEGDALQVMEVELIEPELFLGWSETAADMLADVVLRRLRP